MEHYFWNNFSAAVLGASLLGDFSGIATISLTELLVVNLIILAVVGTVVLNIKRRFLSFGTKKLKISVPKRVVSASIVAKKAFKKIPKKSYVTTPKPIFIPKPIAIKSQEEIAGTPTHKPLPIIPAPQVISKPKIETAQITKPVRAFGKMHRAEQKHRPKILDSLFPKGKPKIQVPIEQEVKAKPIAIKKEEIPKTIEKPIEKPAVITTPEPIIRRHHHVPKLFGEKKGFLAGIFGKKKEVKRKEEKIGDSFGTGSVKTKAPLIIPKPGVEAKPIAKPVEKQMHEEYKKEAKPQEHLHAREARAEKRKGFLGGIFGKSKLHKKKYAWKPKGEKPVSQLFGGSKLEQQKKQIIQNERHERQMFGAASLQTAKPVETPVKEKKRGFSFTRPFVKKELSREEKRAEEIASLIEQHRVKKKDKNILTREEMDLKVQEQKDYIQRNMQQKMAKEKTEREAYAKAEEARRDATLDVVLPKSAALLKQLLKESELDEEENT
ncbi:hypothetical protein IIC68_02185 [archaeon]|nr:hypothetical protein [archaeon]